MTPTDAQKAAYDNAVSNGATGGSDNPVLDANREKIDVSGAFADVSETFAASCIPDLTFTVRGVSRTIPMTNVCYWLGIIGNVGVMVSLVGALYLIGRG